MQDNKIPFNRAIYDIDICYVLHILLVWSIANILKGYGVLIIDKRINRDNWGIQYDMNEKEHYKTRCYATPIQDNAIAK